MLLHRAIHSMYYGLFTLSAPTICVSKKASFVSFAYANEELFMMYQPMEPYLYPQALLHHLDLAHKHRKQQTYELRRERFQHTVVKT